MADNTTISGGDVIATDDVSGVKYPRTKIQTGADGVAGGDVTKTNPFPASTGAALGGTATLSNVSAATSSTALLSADATRIAVTIWNDSTSVMYLSYGSGTASATACSVKIAADGYYEVPDGCAALQMKGIWAAANGAARITAVT